MRGTCDLLTKVTSGVALLAVLVAFSALPGCGGAGTKGCQCTFDAGRA
jgi:hypothetical protein